MRPLERPTVPLEGRVPRRPGPGARVVLCKCSKTLGVVEGRFFFLRHGGRELTATLPAEVRCERCGRHSLVS